MPPLEPISKQEIKVAIVKLKRKKATGPDQIPNEAFISQMKNKKMKFLKSTRAKVRHINARMKEELHCSVTWESL